MRLKNKFSEVEIYLHEDGLLEFEIDEYPLDIYYLYVDKDELKTTIRMLEHEADKKEVKE